MNVWIDIVNSPHVLFFEPIIRELEQRGHKASITARRSAQTTELLGLFNLPYNLIGQHQGGSKKRKLLDFVGRTRKLVKFAKGKDFNLAVSFNSPWQAAAARLLGIPSAVIMDYDYQPLNHLSFRLACRVIVPKVFSDSILGKCGVNGKKALRFDGLKEQVYLSDFRPEPRFFNRLNIDNKKVIVVMRPEAASALYHSFENPLFDRVLDYVLSDDSTIVIAIPRSPEQENTLRKMGNSNLLLLNKAIDGRNLLYYSDLVISAGGTMNREAAVLGIPTYTIFKGRLGAVDQFLIDAGRMTVLNNPEDFSKIKLEKKKPPVPLLNPHLKDEIVNLILDSTR